jgi:hypothetical protein
MPTYNPLGDRAHVGGQPMVRRREPQGGWDQLLAERVIVTRWKGALLRTLAVVRTTMPEDWKELQASPETRRPGHECKTSE